MKHAETSLGKASFAPKSDSTPWAIGAAAALALHAGVLGVVLGFAGESDTEGLIPDPVMIVELAPIAAAAPAPAVPQPTPNPTPQPEELPEFLAPKITPPIVEAPLPKEVVSAPRPQPIAQPVARRVQPRRIAPTAPPAPPRTVRANAPVTGTGTSIAPGNDPKAKEREMDYYSLVSAHLNRKKRYPKKAKKARQQGIVTVRFTIHRDGNVTGISVKRSSGEAILDQATLDLMRRVSPLPRIPKSLGKDSVTLSLPIEYSLKT